MLFHKWLHSPETGYNWGCVLENKGSKEINHT